MTITERVANGVRFLDAVVPQWPQHVNAECLDLANRLLSGGGPCVMQQLRAHDPAVFDFVAAHPRQQCAWGFRLPNNQAYSRNYARLTQAWRRVIVARRRHLRAVA